MHDDVVGEPERARRTRPRSPRSGCRGAAGRRRRAGPRRPPRAPRAAPPRPRSGGARSRRRPGRRPTTPFSSKRRRAPVKAASPARSTRGSCAQPDAGRQRRGRVEGVVAAGHPQRRPGRAGARRHAARTRTPARQATRSTSRTSADSADAVGEHGVDARRSRTPAATRADPGSSAQATRNAARHDPLGEGVERRADGVRGAVVVEVVGLDVRDDRGGRRVAAGTTRRSRRPRPRRRRRRRRARWSPRLVEVAADRERRVGAAVLQRDREHRGGRGLAVGAGHRDRAPAGHAATASACGAVQHAQPAPAGLDELGVVVADRAWTRPRCRRRRRAPASWPTCTVAPSARSASSVARVLGVAAATPAGRARA